MRLPHHVRKISITTRMILYFYLLLIIQMVIIGWFSYSWISNYQKDTYINYMQVSNNGLLQQINYIRSYFEDQSDKILFNETIQEVLIKNKDATPGLQTHEDVINVNRLLYDPTDTIYMLIVQENGILYQPYSNRNIGTSYEVITQKKAYLKSLESDGGYVWTAATEDMMYNKKDLRANENEPYLYLCRRLNSLEYKPRPLGQLLIQIPINALSDIFKESDMKDGEYYAIVDSDGYYIYNTLDINLIGGKADGNILSVLTNSSNGYEILTDNKQDYLVSYSPYHGSGWSVVHVLPMRAISANAGKVRNYVMLIMMCSLLVLLPLLVILTRDLSRPIRQLKTVVERFGNGDLTIREKTNRMDEIGHLQMSFNQMAEDINRLLSKITEEHKQTRLLELNILEYQINPHFLYNSLDSINSMARVAGNKDIEEMVCALAKFLRMGLSKGKELYLVRDELEHVRQYLLINMIRYRDCFTFDIEADPGILEHMTIKIILQPIVENAIKYGINKKNTDGYIKISVKRDGNTLLFEVTDNGPGIPENKLHALRNLLNDHTIDSDTENGFGLYNINQRIWLRFGEGYGIALDSEMGKGTTVRIRVPVIDSWD